MIAGADPALLTVGQACTAPSDGHAPMVTQCSSLDGRNNDAPETTRTHISGALGCGGNTQTRRSHCAYAAGLRLNRDATCQLLGPSDAATSRA